MLPTPVDIERSEHGRREAFIQLAVLGVSFLAIEEVAPMLLDPESAVTGAAGSIMKHGGLAVIQKVSWLKVAVVASVIPLAVDVIHRFIKKTPKRVVQRAVVSSAVNTSDTYCTGVTEDTVRQVLLWQSGSVGVRQSTAYEDSRINRNGEDECNPDDTVLPVPPVHTRPVADTDNRPERGVILRLDQRSTRQRNIRNDRTGKIRTRGQRTDHERSLDTD
jgi:hypothetical protein